MKELLFTQVENKIYPHLQLVGTFFVSNRLLVRDSLEVRPLTLGHLFYALARNHGRIIYWRFVRTLYKLGFIEIPVAEAFSWYLHFRWFPKRKYARRE